jgi:hypothetical protein
VPCATPLASATRRRACLPCKNSCLTNGFPDQWAAVLCVQEWDKIWTINKRIIDPVAPRYSSVWSAGAVPLHLVNGPAEPEVHIYPLHKKNPDVGKKAITRCQVRVGASPFARGSWRPRSQDQVLLSPGFAAFDVATCLVRDSLLWCAGPAGSFASCLW